MTPEEARIQLVEAIQRRDRDAARPGPEAAISVRHSEEKIASATTALGGDRAAAERYLSRLGRNEIDPAKLAQEARLPAEPKAQPQPPTPAPPVPPVPPVTAPPAAPPVPADAPLGGRGDLPPGVGRVWLQGDLAAEVTEIESELLTGMDKAFDQVNQAHFAIPAANAWKPAGAQLPTGPSISRLTATADAIAASQARIQTAVDALREACKSDEPIIRRELEKPLKTLNSAGENLGMFGQITQPIRDMGSAGSTLFGQFRAKLREQRRLVAQAADQRYQKGKAATSSVFGAVPPVQIALDGAGVGRAVLAVDAVTSAMRPVESMKPVRKNGLLPSTRGGGTPSGRGERYSGAPAGDPAKGSHPLSDKPGAPSPGAPGSTPGGKEKPGGEKPGKIDPNALMQALQGAGTPQAPQVQPPQMPTMPQMQNPMGGQQNPMSQIPPQMSKQLDDLLGGNKPTPEVKPETKFDPTPAGDAAKRDMPAADAPIGTATPAAPGGDPKAGEQPRKHQLDSTGTPVDRNRDGKVDRNAIPLSEMTKRPFDLKLDVAPDLKISLDDARIGETMLNLEDGTPDDPKSVLDALNESGIKADELGKEVDPKDIRPGDAVVSEKGSGLYLGDDKVLLGTGETVPLQELLDANGKVFEVPLPDLPKEVDLTPEQQAALTAHDNGQARPNEMHAVPPVDPATGQPVGDQGGVGGDKPPQGGDQPKPPENAAPAAQDKPADPAPAPAAPAAEAKPIDQSQAGAGQPAPAANAPVAGPPPSSAYVPAGGDEPPKVAPPAPAEQPKAADGPQQIPYQGHALG